MTNKLSEEEQDIVDIVKEHGPLNAEQIKEFMKEKYFFTDEETFVKKSDIREYFETEGSTVYVLLVDDDATMRSRCMPFGIAVRTREEAERFVEEGGVGYYHSYTKVRVFDNKDEAIKWESSND